MNDGVHVSGEAGKEKRSAKVRNSVLLSVLMTGSFLAVAILDLYNSACGVFTQFIKDKAFFLTLMCMVTVVVCTLILIMVPKHLYKYAVAVLFELLLAVYILLYVLGIPDQCIEVWAKNKDIELSAEEKIYEYQLGELLSFGEPATAKEYCVTGFSLEPAFAWTIGNYARMQFRLPAEKEDLVLKFTYGVYAPPQRLIVYGNGIELGRATVSEPGILELDIPAEYVPNKNLKLEFGLPDAVSPAARGESGDGRLLALNLEDICIYSKNEIEEQFDYQIGEVLSFVQPGSAEKYCVSGFSLEPSNAWTSEQNAEMHFNLKGEYSNLTLEFGYGVYAPPQEVNIFVNGNRIDSFTAFEGGTRSVAIPNEYVQEGRLDLGFEFPDAVSPASRGENGDGRLLALNMKDIRIFEEKNAQTDLEKAD